jgi:hypothetical protein
MSNVKFVVRTAQGQEYTARNEEQARMFAQKGDEYGIVLETYIRLSPKQRNYAEEWQIRKDKGTARDGRWYRNHPEYQRVRHSRQTVSA